MCNPFLSGPLEQKPTSHIRMCINISICSPWKEDVLVLRACALLLKNNTIEFAAQGSMLCG